MQEMTIKDPRTEEEKENAADLLKLVMVRIVHVSNVVLGEVVWILLAFTWATTMVWHGREVVVAENLTH